MKKRQLEILNFQKMIFPVLENKNIADQDKYLIKKILQKVTEESISLNPPRKKVYFTIHAVV